MSISSCTITGHKSTRFKFKYQEDYSLCKKIKRSLASLIEKAYQDGSRTFFVGGALGVDMWAGEIISEMKATPEYADIHLICTLPFAGYD
ncbi:MAG: SLOG family protein, partial [Oscillospiraceae bacterium]|nr:SLOG family protein [Oscillospiraceae bacterium]